MAGVCRCNGTCLAAFIHNHFSPIEPLCLLQLGSRSFWSIGHNDHALARGDWRFGSSSASPRYRRFAPLGFYWIQTYCLISVYSPVRTVDQFNHWLNSTWHEFTSFRFLKTPSLYPIFRVFKRQNLWIYFILAMYVQYCFWKFVQRK